MSIVRIGLAETQSYSEGWNSIFTKAGGKPKTGKKPATAKAVSKAKAKPKKSKK